MADTLKTPDFLTPMIWQSKNHGLFCHILLRHDSCMYEVKNTRKTDFPEKRH